MEEGIKVSEPESNEDMVTGTPSTSSESAAGSGEDSIEVTDPVDQLAALATERDKLAAENAELADRLLRRQAEFDNFRKRVEREKLELLEYAGIDTVRVLLPVLDDLERALLTECADKEYQRGLALIHQRLGEALKKAGLEVVEAENAKFDPNLHHAVDRLPTADVEEDTIVSVYQKGYLYKGRLLRPAMVKVAVQPE